MEGFWEWKLELSNHSRFTLQRPTTAEVLHEFLYFKDINTIVLFNNPSGARDRPESIALLEASWASSGLF